MNAGAARDAAAAMRIVGILLSAGRGARFGGAKLLAPLPGPVHGVSAGAPIGVVSCGHLVAALPDVVAVVRPGDSVLAGRFCDIGARVVECARADEGMGCSLACGVMAAADADGWVIALADMPWIAPATIAAVADALKAGADIAAAAYQGRRAHPVGFGRRHFAALSALTGDDGARSIVGAHLDRLRMIHVDDEGVVRDVDTMADLRGP